MTQTPQTNARRSSLFQLAPAIVVVLAAMGASAFALWGYPHAITSGHASSWHVVFSLGALVLFLSVTVAVIPVARHDIDTNNAFVAALVATAALVPTTVTEITTVAAYVSVYVTPKSIFPSGSASWLLWIHNLALVIGTSAGLLAWAVWAGYYRHLVRVSSQNTSMYARLCNRTAEVKAALTALPVQDSPAPTKTESIARGIVERHLAVLEGELPAEGGGADTGGLRWVLATGYIALWQRLHRAEESLVLLLPSEEVTRIALHDAQRLQGSAVPSAAELVALVRHAAVVISPSMEWYFSHFPMPALLPAQLPGGGISPANITPVAAMAASTGSSPGGVTVLTTPAPAAVMTETQTNGASAVPETPPGEQQSARAAISEVRHIINNFRDTRWDALVRRRNHLLEAVVFTRITAFAVLGLVILSGVLPSAIMAATIFYLVGALVGLFKRLQSSSADSLSVEDYGLSTATLTQTAPFSGLAAVGGVLLTGLVGATLNGTHATATDLGSIFDLGKNQFGIIIAAIFGLTPSLLTGKLEKISDGYKSDLKTTEASGGPTG